MQIAEEPKDEQSRLAALYSYNLLDTLSEQEYDDITALASSICETPISLISLVDKDRQWFKSIVGLNVDETPRDVAFCAHAIVKPDKILEVEDTTKDKRFADNPLVTSDPNIRFYAGAPLKDSHGHALGTLCVIDSKPRKLSPLQKKTLGVLARQAITLIELKKIRTRYDSLFENTGDLIYELDEDGRYIFFNQTMMEVTGYSYEELNGKLCWEFIPEDYRKRTKDFYLEKVKAQEKSCYFEFPIRSKSGGTVWLGQSVDYVYLGHRAIRTYAVARDLTKFNESTEKLEKYKEGLRLLNELSSIRSINASEQLTEGLRVCTEYLDLDGGIISEIEDDKYTVLEYYPPENEALMKNPVFDLGDTYCDITYKSNETLAIHHMSDSVHRKHPCFENFKLETYIGAPYFSEGVRKGTVNFTGKAVRKEPFSNYDIDFVSLITRWVGHTLEQQATRTKLVARQNILKAFVQSAPAAIAMFDRETRYIAASKKWYNDYNIKKDVIGQSHYDVFPEIGDEWRKIHKKALKGEIISKNEDQFIRKDGTVQWLKWEVRPWHETSGEIGGIIMFTDNITLFKQQEEELKKAKEVAEESGKVKEQFLSTMSHEIRTPLNAIIGTTNLLLLEHPELADNERLKLLKFGSNNLLSLINNVLDYQKIESGNLSLENSTFNLKELATSLVETWQPAAKERGITLKLKYKVNTEENVMGDDTRLGQVINNLISNALKFTGDGLVALEITSPGPGKIRFEVRDTGVGIPEDKLDMVFESFKQISSDQTLEHGGTGLGLSISKKLVRLMQGELEVSSQVGFGSKFMFTLPLKPSYAITPDRSETTEALHAQALKGLLVEDNVANQAIAVSFLERWSIKVDVANNGKEALKKVSDQRYDFILMDLRMPVMNGYEATSAIRKIKGDYFKKVPIIALTASTMFETRKKIDACGMNAFVAKPFKPEDLFARISEVTSIKPTQSLQEREVASFKFLSGLYGDNPEQILKIADLSIQSIEKALSILQKAIKKKDQKAVDEAIHLIKPNLIHLDSDHLLKKVPKDINKPGAWNKLIKFIALVSDEIKLLKN